jgi:putative transposase
MGGIARKNRMKALAIGGIEDHCHILLSLPTNLDVAHAIQLVKAGSSKWMHEQVGRKLFACQENYAAFTVKKLGFDEELKLIFAKHGIAPED